MNNFTQFVETLNNLVNYENVNDIKIIDENGNSFDIQNCEIAQDIDNDCNVLVMRFHNDKQNKFLITAKNHNIDYVNKQYVDTIAGNVETILNEINEGNPL